MYGNKLTSLNVPSDPELMGKLEYLDVGYNQLTAIPIELAKLPLKTLKCMNNLIEIIPAAICDMELRALDVSSNPLIQPPLETCERGLHSMRRYYHCLKLEEMAGPDFQQQTQTQRIFKKTRVKIRKKKDVAKKAFAAPLCRSSMFRNISEPNGSIHGQTPTEFGDTMPPFFSRQEDLPMRSVSFSSAKGGPEPPGVRHTSSLTMPAKLTTQQESYYSDDSVDSDTVPTKNPKLVGLNKAEQMADEITVNDTLKVIFVGMALSGKTSIIKRLIEGKDAKIPQKDERTIGVDIYEWKPKSADGPNGSLDTQIPIDGELASRIKGDVDVKFSVWDFAGQHVYHVSQNFMGIANMFNYCLLTIFYTTLNMLLSRQHTSSSFPLNLCMSLYGIWA